LISENLEFEKKILKSIYPLKALYNGKKMDETTTCFVKKYIYRF